MKMKMKMERGMGIEHNEKSAVLNGTARGPRLKSCNNDNYNCKLRPN